MAYLVFWLAYLVFWLVYLVFWLAYLLLEWCKWCFDLHILLIAMAHLVFWLPYLEYFLSGWRIWCLLCMGWCICYMRWSIWYFGWIIFITKIARIAFIFGLNKLCSKQSLSRSLWKKVRRLEKSTPTPLVRCWLISALVWSHWLHFFDIFPLLCLFWASSSS